MANFLILLTTVTSSLSTKFGTLNFEVSVDVKCFQSFISNSMALKNCTFQLTLELSIETHSPLLSFAKLDQELHSSVDSCTPFCYQS